MTYLDPVRKLVKEVEVNDSNAARLVTLLPLLLDVCEAGERYLHIPTIMEMPAEEAAREVHERKLAFAAALDSLRQHLEGTPHDHPSYVEGCFRCDLSREEGK